ncbi:hypothetical protein CDL15_Pgr025718 [Punica granatum]|uniref:Uncharacterized protein n=1 Tax=Punica granatum TaxID=22663 RepID=A0A218WBK2_PUNGR|nr:hypothetical protein CDL15_Pgr025718 [Punica granatum]
MPVVVVEVPALVQSEALNHQITRHEQAPLDPQDTGNNNLIGPCHRMVGSYHASGGGAGGGG